MKQQSRTLTAILGVIGTWELPQKGVIAPQDSIIRCNETPKCGVATPRIGVSHSKKQGHDTSDGHHLKGDVHLVRCQTPKRDIIDSLDGSHMLE